MRFSPGSPLIPYAVLALFLAAFFCGLNAAYPLLGHDWYYFFPRLLVGRWHALGSGWSPLRWAPQLCGGFPVYGNPHDVFYSLPQLLSLVLGLWTSVQLTVLCAMLLGYAGWYRMGRDVLRLDAAWSHALALVTLANGYYFMHVIAGHLSFAMLPLAGWFLWLLFDRTDRLLRPSFARMAAFALLAACTLYQAGYFALLLTGITAALFLPFDLLHAANPKRRAAQVGMRSLCYGVVTLALCASKLVAVWSLMRFLPRSTAFDHFAPDTSALAFMLKAFFAMPQGSFLFSSDEKIWGIHEYSMFLSPVILVGLACLAWHSLREYRRIGARKTALIFVYSLVLVFLFAQLTRGYGVFPTVLHGLPIFSSLRVVVRFLYAPSLLLGMGGVLGLAWLSEHRLRASSRAFAAPLVGLATVGAFLCAYAPMLIKLHPLQSVKYQEVQEGIALSGYLHKAVDNVHILPAEMPSDLRSVFAGTTSPGCYEPLLKGVTILQPLTEGSVEHLSDGFYNLRNPACLQYPAQNDCKPGDRIAGADAQNLLAFRNGLPTTWRLSPLQRAADLLTLLLLAACVSTVLWSGYGFVPSVAASLRRLLFRIRKHPSVLVAMSALRLSVPRAVLRESPGSAESFRRLLIWAAVASLLALVIGMCAFKMTDRDIWWHITAGKIMLQTGSLIATEPFAWTRAGLPYLATHEWLAQIILTLLWSAGGSTALIVFRTFVLAACLAIIARLCRRGLWLLFPVFVLAIIALQPTMMERPQLFSFVIYSTFLTLTFSLLDSCSKRAPTKREKYGTALAFFLLQILWVNTHGGAGMLAFFFPVALGIDALARTLGSRQPLAALPARSLWIAGLGAALAIGFFVSPTTYHNATYLWNLLTDRTIIYILEWQPRPLDQYFKLIVPLWIIGFTAIASGRKHMLASLFLFGLTGWLSLKALRHESFFVLTTLAVTLHQVSNMASWKHLHDWLLKRRTFTAIAACLMLAACTTYARTQYVSFTHADQIQGYGLFDYGKSAADFVEREQLSGKMFNTYGIGAYLLYRGYPDRQVFIDGRNVDYGFAFMNLNFLAGKDSVQWKKLQEKYPFDFAVVDYFANKDKEHDRLFYSMILEQDPEWAMVYVDDWVAVYLKRTPANLPLIERLSFKLLTAENLEYKSVLADVPVEQWPALEAELLRAVKDDPRSIKARIELSKMFIRQKRLNEAQAMAQDAAIVKPGVPEPHAMFAAIFVQQQQWKKAADELDIMLKLADKDYPDMDYGYLAEVFTKAGRLRQARRYAHKAGLTLRASPVSDQPVTELPPTLPLSAAAQSSVSQSSASSRDVPMVNPAQDALEFGAKALELAQQGRNAEARENFQIAIHLNPSNPQAWNNLATLSFFEKKYDEAKEEYERALKEWPEYSDAHYNLALLLVQTGDSEAAKPHIQKAKELGKDVSPIEHLLQQAAPR